LSRCTAEHGVGTLKRQSLGKTRSAEEIRLMRVLKGALDPAGILNGHARRAATKDRISGCFQTIEPRPQATPVLASRRNPVYHGRGAVWSDFGSSPAGLRAMLSFPSFSRRDDRSGRMRPWRNTDDRLQDVPVITPVRRP